MLGRSATANASSSSRHQQRGRLIKAVHRLPNGPVPVGEDAEWGERLQGRAMRGAKRVESS